MRGLWTYGDWPLDLSRLCAVCRAVELWTDGSGPCAAQARDGRWVSHVVLGRAHDESARAGVPPHRLFQRRAQRLCMASRRGGRGLNKRFLRELDLRYWIPLLRLSQQAKSFFRKGLSRLQGCREPLMRFWASRCGWMWILDDTPRIPLRSAKLLSHRLEV